jgi:hypothetical protein
MQTRSFFTRRSRPLDERHPHLAGEKDMLEIGRVVGAGRQQHHLWFGATHRRDFAHRGDQSQPVIVDCAQPYIVHQIGEGALHDLAVFDHVTDARRRAGIVFQDPEDAVGAADNIGAADIDVGLVRDFYVAHLRPEIIVAEDQIGRNDAIAQDQLAVIEVIEQEVERGDPLDDAALDVPPFRCRDQPGDRVERQDAVDGGAVGIDRKGDAEIVERSLGRGGAPGKLGDRHAGEPLAQRCRLVAALQLAKKAVRVVTVEQRTRLPCLRIMHGPGQGASVTSPETGR